MLTFGVPGWPRAWRWRWSLRLLWGHGEFTGQVCSLWRHQRLIGCFQLSKTKYVLNFNHFFMKTGWRWTCWRPGWTGTTGTEGCLRSICLNFLLNPRTKQLFHPRTCCLSFCPQGGVGMEGPRGGVGVPGEPVRKHHPHNLISFSSSLQVS